MKILLSIAIIFFISGCGNKTIANDQLSIDEKIQNEGFIYDEDEEFYVLDNSTETNSIIQILDLNNYSFAMLNMDTEGQIVTSYNYKTDITEHKTIHDDFYISSTLDHSNDGYSCISDPQNDQSCWIAKEFCLKTYKTFTELLIEFDLEIEDLL